MDLWIDITLQNVSEMRVKTGRSHFFVVKGTCLAYIALLGNTSVIGQWIRTNRWHNFVIQCLWNTNLLGIFKALGKWCIRSGRPRRFPRRLHWHRRLDPYWICPRWSPPRLRATFRRRVAPTFRILRTRENAVEPVSDGSGARPVWFGPGVTRNTAGHA
jgi:hypothetical protein